MNSFFNEKEIKKTLICISIKNKLLNNNATFKAFWITPNKKVAVYSELLFN